METISLKIHDVVLEVFDVDQSVQLSRPDVQFGDYATNVAMQLAKPLSKNPREIAEQLADALRGSELFSDVTVAGPGFINFRVTASSLERSLTELWSQGYGENQDGEGKTVIVEYTSPNMAKPYSVGHLRPGNQAHGRGRDRLR